jgi:hypothetical protein
MKKIIVIGLRLLIFPIYFISWILYLVIIDSNAKLDFIKFLKY